MGKMLVSGVDECVDRLGGQVTDDDFDHVRIVFGQSKVQNRVGLVDSLSRCCIGWRTC